MSFDLYLVEPEIAGDVDSLVERFDEEVSWESALTDRLAGAIAELEERFPFDDADGPWASWPLTQSMCHGHCCALNIVWSAADEMTRPIADVARRHGLAVYDPQTDRIAMPGSDHGARQRWWRRSTH